MRIKQKAECLKATFKIESFYSLPNIITNFKNADFSHTRYPYPFKTNNPKYGQERGGGGGRGEKVGGVKHEIDGKQSLKGLRASNFLLSIRLSKAGIKLVCEGKNTPSASRVTDSQSIVLH